MIERIKLTPDNYRGGGTYTYDWGRHINTIDDTYLKIYTIDIAKKYVDSTILEVGITWTDINIPPNYNTIYGNLDVLCELTDGLPELTNINNDYYRWQGHSPIIKKMYPTPNKRELNFYLREQSSIQRVGSLIPKDGDFVQWTGLELDMPAWIELEIVQKKNSF